MRAHPDLVKNSLLVKAGETALKVEVFIVSSIRLIGRVTCFHFIAGPVKIDLVSSSNILMVYREGNIQAHVCKLSKYCFGAEAFSFFWVNDASGSSQNLLLRALPSSISTSLALRPSSSVGCCFLMMTLVLRLRSMSREGSFLFDTEDTTVVDS